MNLYQKPSGIWAVDYVDEQGVRRRVSTGTRDKGEARRKVAIIMGGERPAENASVPVRQPTTSSAIGLDLGGLLHRCETSPDGWREARAQATIRSNVKIIRGLEVEHNGRRVRAEDIAVTQITKVTLTALKDALQDKGYAPASVKRKLDMVGRALVLAEDWGIIDAKPSLPKVKQPDNARQRVLTLQEEAAAFRAIDRRIVEQPTMDWQRLKVLFRFLLDTGCRKSEAENVRLDWISRSPNGIYRLTIPKWVSKSGKSREITLTDAVIEALPFLEANGVRARPNEVPGLKLFPYKHGFVLYRWKQIVEDVKGGDGLDLSDVVLHTFRHTNITRLLEMKWPIERVARWAGHSDISITNAIYTHLRADEMDAGADLLNQLRPSNGGSRASAFSTISAANCDDAGIPRRA